MEVKKIQQEKLRQVEIYYGYDDNEWASITVVFQHACMHSN